MNTVTSLDEIQLHRDISRSSKHLHPTASRSRGRKTVSRRTSLCYNGARCPLSFHTMHPTRPPVRCRSELSVKTLCLYPHCPSRSRWQTATSRCPPSFTTTHTSLHRTMFFEVTQDHPIAQDLRKTAKGHRSGRIFSLVYLH